VYIRPFWTLAIICLISAFGFGQSARLPSYAFSLSSPLPGGGSSVVIGDFNGDGLPDIAAVNRTLISVILGDGKGSFSAPIRTTITPAASAIVVADFNNDGKPDLLAWTPATLTGPSNTTVSILLGNGDGTVSKKSSFNGPDGVIQQLQVPAAIADFNGDGYPDIALANVTTNGVDVRLGNGDGTFRAAVGYPTGQKILTFVLAQDMDLDGRIDLVAINGLVGQSTGDIAVLRGSGDGSFSAPAAALTETFPSSAVQATVAVVCADLNKDKTPDLVIVGSQFFGNVATYIARNGGFERGASYSVPISVSVPAGYPVAVAVGDITADGNPDLVILYDGEVLTVLPGFGDGAFDSPSIYSDFGSTGRQAFPGSLALGDLNGDGRVDVIVGQGTSLGQAYAAGPSVLSGVAAPFLRTRVTHNGDFYLAQSDAAFTIQVSNGGSVSTAGTVTVTDSSNVVFNDSSAYYGIISVGGQGWTCAGITQCSRSDTLQPGASYPPIVVRVEVDFPPSSYPFGNRADLSGGGSAPNEAIDRANVLPYQQHCLYTLNSPRTVDLGIDGGEIDFSVDVGNDCPYSVQAADPWIRIDGEGYVGPNSTGLPRTSSINFVSPLGWKDSIVVNQTSAPGCMYRLPWSSATVGPDAYYLIVTVTTFLNCSWVATSNTPWITFGGPTSGYGWQSGVYLRFAANLSGKFRTGTVSISGQTFTVYQTGANATVLGSLPHWAVGGGWESSIELVNTNNAPAQAYLTFFDDSGNIPLVPLSAPDDPAISPYLPPYLLSAFGAFQLDSSGPGALLPSTGAASLSGEAGVSGYVRFRYSPSQQEALVPLETRNAKSYVLAFDNTAGFATGAAIGSADGQPASVHLIARDESGTTIASETISLASFGHSSFMVTERFPSTAGRRGTLEFSASGGVRIGVLGLRFSAAGTFTSVPVMTDTESGTGNIAQLAFGAGWGSTITLINTADSPANTQLQFFDDGGNPLVLPISFPAENPSPTTASSIQRTLAPHSMVTIQTSVSENGSVQVGSARLSGDAGVSGFIVFHTSAAQEAAVPMQASGTNGYLLAFDNTGGRQTGLALAVDQSGSKTVSFVLRDQKGVQFDSGSLSLPANGHSSFLLQERFPSSMNRRGTLQVGTPQGSTLGLVGLSFTQTGAFTTIPALPQ
jgi:hypothetical protein